jgi:hypothetical protein
MRAAAHVFGSGGGSGSEGGGIGDCLSNSQMMDVDAHGPVRPASACDSDILPTYLSVEHIEAKHLIGHHYRVFKINKTEKP